MLPLILSDIWITCPDCAGERFYEGEEDEEEPTGLPNPCFCPTCGDADGLKKVQVPTRLLLRAYREGRTDQQVYDELTDYLRRETR